MTKGFHSFISADCFGLRVALPLKSCPGEVTVCNTWTLIDTGDLFAGSTCFG